MLIRFLNQGSFLFAEYRKKGKNIMAKIIAVIALLIGVIMYLVIFGAFKSNSKADDYEQEQYVKRLNEKNRSHS